MMVNLPCLMGSGPNFLRSTCSYTECQLSFQTGSCPTERTSASYSSCLILISWPCPQACLLISVDAYPCCAAGHCVMKYSLHYIDNNGFLFPEPCPASVVSGARQDPGYFSFMRIDYAAAVSCFSDLLMSPNIFFGSYFVPFVKMTYMTLNNLHAITVRDCIFLSGLSVRIV